MSRGRAQTRPLRDTDSNPTVGARRRGLARGRDMHHPGAECDPGAERVRRQVQQIASVLLDQSAISVVKAQQHLLEEVAGDQ